MDFKQFYKTINFDIDNEIRTVFQATQGDTKSRGLVVDLIVGGVKTPVTTENMTFYALKPDGTRVMTQGVKDGTGFRIDFTNQTFAVPGVLLCTLVLSGTNGEKIADKKFKMTVDSSLEDGAIVSEDERGILDRAFDLASDIVPRLEALDVPLLENLEQEVILARGTEPTLGARLDWTDAQLAETENYISPIKAYITSGKNKFNKDKKIYGTYLTTTGVVAPITGYSTLDEWLPVKAGIPYVITNMRWICLYNTSKVFTERIDRSGIGNAFVFTPSIDGYIRLSGYDGSTGKYWFDGGYFAQESSYSGYEAYKSIINNLTFADGQKDEIKAIVSEQLALPVKVEKTGENFKLSSDFDGVNEIVINTIRNGSNNGAFKFNGTTVGTDNIHDTIDDITPIYTFIALGAGHGYMFNKVVSSSHDKMPADIGSKWSDGVNTFTLMGINGNELIFAVQYTESDGIVSASIVSIVADLTHVSSATNTSTITRESTTSFQFYPSVKNVSVEYVLDGKPIDLDGVYHGKELVIHEKYTVLDYKSMLDYHQANIGVVYNPNNIDGILEISNTFIYRDKLKCTTSHSLSSLKKCRIDSSGFMQSTKLSLSGHTTMRYLPGVLPKSGFDFSAGVDLATYNTTINYYTGDLKDPTKPPAFYVDWLLNGDIKKYGFSMGYIVDKTNSKSSDRLTNCIYYWDMRSTGKSYPRAIGGKVLNPGDYMNFMGFRNYLSPDESINIVGDNKSSYAYILADSSGLISKKLENSIGKSITVLQGELTLLSDTVDTNGISVNGTGSGIFKID